MELSGKDANFITYLSSFLHANGNEVLGGKKKLSLTSSVLCILNKLCIDPNNDNVINDHHMRENWNFLLNVINNVIALKVTHCVETVQGGIDLSMFKSLLMLELKKTPVHLLLGLNDLCSQLETLVCSCSISSLQELQASKSAGMEWTAMKQLNLSHNYLEDFEEGIRLFPNLEVIDVSHNRLINANGLRFLSKLSAVNLGYNNLSKVPTFSNGSFSFLKELSLRNNNLEDLSGLEDVRDIRDLDLSYNCLSEHSVLGPIQNLPYLQVLKLMGNPLAVQRLHRILTAKHLHPNALIAGIKLDGQKLTKSEVGKVVQVRSINAHSIYHEDRIQTNSSFEESIVTGNLRTAMINYPPSPIDGTSVASGSSPKSDTRSVTSVKSDVAKKGTSKPKKRKEKEIIIQDCGNSEQNNINHNVPEKKECKAQELKATLAARRENLGHEWLVSAYSSSLPSENILSTMYIEQDSLKRMPEHQETSVQHQSDNNIEDSVFATKTAFISIEEVERVKHPEEVDKKAMKKISVASDGIEVICSDHIHQDEIINNDFNMCKSCMQSKHDDDLGFQDNGNAYEIKYGIAEEDENPESNIFLVEKKVSENGTATIFISIGEKYLNEKDVLSTDLLDSLDLSVLDNVEILEKNIIKLHFKIFKVSKRERIYYAENEAAAKEILRLLIPYADARNLKSIVKNALRCLKCDAQFTRNILNERYLSDTSHSLAKYLLVDNTSSETDFEDKDRCPVCQSLMIVEDSDCPITVTLLQKASYSPAVISGYLFVPQNTSSSSVSTDFSTNLLLTFKHPLKVKQETIHAPDKVAESHGGSINDSDDSSVCTALEYTSEELAGNFLSTNSLDLTQSNDNLDCCAKQLPCATKTDDYEQQEEDEQGNNDEANMYSTVTDTHLQKSVNGGCKGLIDNAEEIAYDTFTNINHTLKLYIEMQLFDANEELEASAEAIIVPHSSSIKSKGLLLLSTKRLHFMKLAENLGDEPEKNISPLEAVRLNLLHTVLIFIGNQGVSFICGTEKNPSDSKVCYTCFFRDADYCCSFIAYFRDFIKQSIPSFPAIIDSSEYSLNQLKEDVLLTGAHSGTGDISTEILAFLVVEWCHLATSGREKETVALILTSTDICLTEIIFTKQNNKSAKFSKPVERYAPLAKQKVTNLISVHPHFDSCKIGLHFLDEDSNQELSWIIMLKTKQTLCLLINTLKEHWQESFGVEMKLEVPVDCSCNV